MNFRESLDKTIISFFSPSMVARSPRKIETLELDISELFIKLIEEQPSLSIIGLDSSIDRQALINAIKEK